MNQNKKAEEPTNNQNTISIPPPGGRMKANIPFADITFPLTLEDVPALEREVQFVLSLPASELASLPSVWRFRYHVMAEELKELKAKVAATGRAATANEGGAK